MRVRRTVYSVLPAELRELFLNLHFDFPDPRRHHHVDEGELREVDLRIGGPDRVPFPRRDDAQEVHIKGIFDDKGRMMVIICHNTDLGDGWEQEGVDPGYFREYAEKWSYPLGINILTYAMTH